MGGRTAMLDFDVQSDQFAKIIIVGVGGGGADKRVYDRGLQYDIRCRD